MTKKDVSIKMDRQVFRALCEGRRYPDVAVMMNNGYELDESDLDFLIVSFAKSFHMINHTQIYQIIDTVCLFIHKKTEMREPVWQDKYWEKAADEEAGAIKKIIDCKVKIMTIERLDLVAKINLVAEYERAVSKMSKNISFPKWTGDIDVLKEIQQKDIIEIIAIQKVVDEKHSIDKNMKPSIIKNKAKSKTAKI